MSLKHLSSTLVALLLLSPLVHAEPVNINTADATALAKALNGIGPAKAKAIVSYREKNVTADDLARREMEKKSGQTKAPTLDWNGKVLADFGVDELGPFLRERGVQFEDS